MTKTAGLIIWNSLGFFLKLGQPFFIFSTVFNLALYIDNWYWWRCFRHIWAFLHLFWWNMCIDDLYICFFLKMDNTCIPPFFENIPSPLVYCHSRSDIIYHQDHINQGLTINTQGQQEKCRHKMSLCQFFHLFFRHWPLMCHGGVGNLVKSFWTQLTNTRPSLWSLSIIGWK